MENPSNAGHNLGSMLSWEKERMGTMGKAEWIVIECFSRKVFWSAREGVGARVETAVGTVDGGLGMSLSLCSFFLCFLEVDSVVVLSSLRLRFFSPLALTSE